MRTTLEIPEELIEQACRLSGVKTKTMAVVMALQHLVNSKKIERMRGLRGKIQLDIDLDSLRANRLRRNLRKKR